MTDDSPDPVSVVLAYHERTKHRPHLYAASLGYMDWSTQPDPFRRYDGASLRALDLVPAGTEPRYEPAFLEGSLPVAPPSRAAISQLFQDSLGLSAWKEAGASRWALRMNPSSGNLHPTEGYLVTGAVPGLCDQPMVAHYAPHEHAVEVRAELDAGADWAALGLPEGGMLVGLTSIHWREAWKYGERAFRYCHHDVGHAIAGLAVAAAGLGLRTRLLPAIPDADLAVLLGVASQVGPDAEHPDALLLLSPVEPDADWVRTFTLPPSLLAALAATRWHGAPNALSRAHHPWPEIDRVALAVRKLDGAPPPVEPPSEPRRPLPIGDSRIALRSVLHARRSAVSLDGRTGLTREAFEEILWKLLPGPGQVPFRTFAGSPHVDLLLFVHRVAGLAPGLYALVRDGARQPSLRAQLSEGFAWTRTDPSPEGLPLYLLEEGDARRVAAQASCGQEIAADGAFAVAMLADFADHVAAAGAPTYRALFWEAGIIGQLLYLEAEASGVRGTGIGCFFDDVTHQIFGITGTRSQVIYHFTVGGPIEDTRIQTRPPYDHLTR